MPVVYRVANHQTDRGLWYREDGAFDPLITKLPGAISGQLPMGFDPNMKLGGQAWLSCTDSLPALLTWFSLDDIRRLEAWGYAAYAYDVTGYRKVPGHEVFTKDAVIRSRRLDSNIFLKAAA